MKRMIKRLIRSIVLYLLRIFYKILRVDQIYYQALYDMNDIPRSANYCLILGAKLFDDDSIPPILKERLDAAIRLYRHNPNTVFILSGDGRKRISNDVNAMYQYLRHASDIPEDHLVTDNAGYTTYDSIINLTRRIGEAEPFVLLTSAFHLPRSLYICHALHLTAYAVYLPVSRPQAQTGYRNRELAALVKSWYRVHFHTPRLYHLCRRLRFTAMLLLGKGVFFGLRLLGKGATTYPGRLMVKYCPDAFTYLTRHISLILVTGTNGKTSTCRLLEHVLRAQGIRCFSNRSGANLRFGVATTLLTHCSIFGRYKERYAILECDEGDFAKIADQFTSQNVTLVVTNLSHDQLDRYGDLEHVKNYVLCGIECLPQATLCLNSDCPETASLASSVSNSTYYYGIHKESAHCSTQETPLSPDCILSLTSQGDLTFQTSDTVIHCGNKAPIPPDYSLYNSLAAATVLHHLGLSQGIASCFSADFYNPGRFETIQVNDTCYTLILIKNPAGCRQALQCLPTDLTDIGLVFAISDRISDGQDISWIWDCDFAALDRVTENTTLYFTGTRYSHMAVRLKYAGLDPKTYVMEPNIPALFTTLQRQQHRVYLFTTYSSMLEIRAHLETMTPLKKFWDQ